MGNEGWKHVEKGREKKRKSPVCGERLKGISDFLALHGLKRALNEGFRVRPLPIKGAIEDIL